MHWFVFLIFLLPLSLQAQNITASFNPASVGENPAAAATRDFGVISPFVSMTNIEQVYDSNITSSSKAEWTREINLQRYESVIAGRGKSIVPELYLSYNIAKITAAPSDKSMETKDDIGIFNNLINIAYHYSPTFKFGISFFYPQLKYKSETQFGSSTDSGYRYSNELKELGIGLGTSVFLTQGLAVGLFAQDIQESLSYKSESASYSLSAYEVASSYKYEHKKIGGGFSYQSGNSKGGGFRFEATAAKMIFANSQVYSGSGHEANNKTNTLIRVALEATTMGFTGGVAYNRVEGRYINYRFIADSVISNFPFFEKPVNLMSGFFGFKNKSGSSFGGYVNYASGDSNIQLMSNETPAKVTEYSVGLGYAYSY